MRRKPSRGVTAQEPLQTTPTCLSIGECNVSIPRSLSYSHIGDSLLIEVPNKGQVTITCATASAGIELKKDSAWSANNSTIFKQDSQGLSFLEGSLVQILNPKSLDNDGHLLLKAVLKLYSMELPEMSFAANTGKESPFLEKKYCTLLLKGGIQLNYEVLAAVSYQILPPDTQYAEIPLAAVSKDYQHKGVGSFLFNELQRRLQDVGVVTIFCWGDQESETFWLKQGFFKVAEVDGHGKPRKLPIKPDIRRAMSIPGSATLLVSHISSKPVINVTNDKGAVTPPRLVQLHSAKGLHESAPPVLKPSPAAPVTTPMVGELKTSLQVTPLPAIEKQFVKSSSMMPLNIDGAFSNVATQNESKRSTTPSELASYMHTPMEPTLSLTFAPPSQHVTPELVVPNQEGKAGVQDAQTSFELNMENVHVRSYRRGRKRGRPSASPAQMHEKQRKVHDSSQTSERRDSESMVSQQNSVLMELPDSNIVTELLTKQQVTETCVESGEKVLQDQGFAVNINHQSCPTIMFMNMVDDNRRMQLTKFVERLGGRVTNDGNQCTHVVTGETRRTLNFCIALNAGAWVVSPAWLKASVKEKRFIEEAAFVLKDAAFENKYKITLEEVIRRRKQRPCGLLEGMCIYPTKHVQPPVETISAIVLSAGGKVLASLEEAKDCLDAIVVACEDDISEALMAAKAGLPTYSSEWLMGCIMKQELDVTTAQFAESL